MSIERGDFNLRAPEERKVVDSLAATSVRLNDQMSKQIN